MVVGQEERKLVQERRDRPLRVDQVQHQEYGVMILGEMGGIADEMRG